MAEFLVILALLVAGLLIMVPTIKYIVEPLKTLSDFMDDTKANYNPLSQIVVPPVSKKHTAKEIIVLNQTFSNLLQELSLIHISSFSSMETDIFPFSQFK